MTRRSRPPGVTKCDGPDSGENPGALTPKERRFVEEYPIDWNASDAARRAGYKTSPHGSTPDQDVALRMLASRLLRRPRVRLAIQQRLEELSQLCADQSVCPRCGTLRAGPRQPPPLPTVPEDRSSARLVRPWLRTQVMERDGFRCRRCGAGPQEARLVVDHIVPVAKGGTADPSNLQTLCEPCNVGKRDNEPHSHDLESAS